MAKGQQRNLKKKAFWRGVVGRFAKCGLTIRRFCAQERVSEPAFYFWRRVIRERDQRQPVAPAFVPVVLREELEASNGTGIVIEVKGGPRSMTLRLPTTMPMGQVAELVGAIDAVPTTAENRA